MGDDGKMRVVLLVWSVFDEVVRMWKGKKKERKDERQCSVDEGFK